MPIEDLLALYYGNNQDQAIPITTSTTDPMKLELDPDPEMEVASQPEEMGEEQLASRGTRALVDLGDEAAGGDPLLNQRVTRGCE